MSVREFADHLGVSARTVFNWEADGPRIQPRPVWQAALDTVLRGAGDEVGMRFEAESIVTTAADQLAGHERRAITPGLRPLAERAGLAG